jgi:RTX calcium-binding nonapeptide repeat (4 copies)
VYAVVRQGRCIVGVVAFLIGCAFLLVVGCAGVGSEAPQKEQGSSPKATASEEEARCQGTQTLKLKDLYKLKYPSRGGFGKNTLVTTNDLPGCPKGGLLSGTYKVDKLDGGEGDDEVRALGGEDILAGGKGNDVVYGGPGSDDFDDPDEGDDVFYGGDGGDAMWAGGGEDVLYGGDDNDFLTADEDGQRDKIYCGKGKDLYSADKIDYVDSSCEKINRMADGGSA